MARLFGLLGRCRHAPIALALLAAMFLALRTEALHRHGPESDSARICAVCAHAASPLDVEAPAAVAADEGAFVERTQAPAQAPIQRAADRSGDPRGPPSGTRL